MKISVNPKLSIYVHTNGCTEHQTELSMWESEFG